MLKRRTLFWSLLAIPVVAFTGWRAYAHGRGMHRDPERMSKFVEFRVNDVLDDLNATDAQKKNILEIVRGVTKDAGGVMKEGRDTHDEMLELFTQPAVDAKLVHARIDERAKAMQAMAHRVADAALKVHTQLTPEQRAELAEIISEHHPRRGGPF